MEDRIIRLEERLVYLERTVSDLDGVVRDFGSRLDRLNRSIAELTSRKDSLDPSNALPPDRSS